VVGYLAPVEHRRATICVKRVVGSIGRRPLLIRAFLATDCQKKAMWQMSGVDLVLTLSQANVSQGIGRGPLPAMVLPRHIVQVHPRTEVRFV